MTNHVLYEEPKLSFKEWLKSFWNYTTIYERGYKDGKGIRTGLKESNEASKESAGGPRPKVSGSSSTELKET